MKNIEKIRSRINKRKNNKGLVYKIAMSFMVIYCLFLSVMIYAKEDSEAKYVNKILHTDINFTKLNGFMNKLINFRVIYDDSSKEKEVSSINDYLYLENDYFSKDDGVVNAMWDGVVIYYNGKDEVSNVIVLYDNGIRVSYSELIDVCVRVNDRVYKDDVIGEFNEKVKIMFFKDDNKLDYEEVINFK